MTIKGIDLCKNCMSGNQETMKKHSRAGEITATAVDKISEGASFAINKGIQGVSFLKKKYEKSHKQISGPMPVTQKKHLETKNQPHIYEKD